MHRVFPLVSSEAPPVVVARPDGMSAGSPGREQRGSTGVRGEEDLVSVFGMFSCRFSLVFSCIALELREGVVISDVSDSLVDACAILALCFA